MTDIEKKALALVNEVSDGFHDVTSLYAIHTAKALRSALCRAIEQHEAFRQEVSDALSVYQKADGVEERSLTWDAITRFIIPKPDPLVEVLACMGLKPKGGYDWASEFRNTLAKRGGKIVWEDEE